MTRRARWIAGLCVALAVPAGVEGVRAGGSFPTAAQDEDTLFLAKSDYVENCGGCHGIQGTSAPANIPVLRDRIGWFMCTPAARAYLIRLPNVAHSRLADNAQLAEMMNFTVFGLGGTSVPANAPRFTADEVARERRLAMSTQSLVGIRTKLVEALIRSCKAPASLRKFYPGQPPGQQN